MFIIDGVLINSAILLSTGVFLSGYIVYLKGSDFLVGLLNNSSTWAAVAAVSAFLVYERMKKRKKLLLVLNIVSRLMICSIVFLPLISKDNVLVLSAVTILVVLGNVIWGFYSIGASVMMISLLSYENRNHYIYVRTFWLRISFTLTSVIMGLILDLFNKSYTGFLVVFVTSLSFSILDAVVLSKVKEPSYKVDDNVKVNIKMFLEPIKNKKYLHYLIFLFFIYLSLTSASSFTPLYLIRYLKFDYGFISIINVITYILMIVCTNFWLRIERARGLNFVLKITAVFIVGEVLIYGFLSNSTFYLLFLAPIIAGIGYSGFNIAITTYRYELMPENNRTIYEGWFGAVLGLSMLVSPVIGSLIMKFMPIYQNSVFQHSNFQLLYLTAAVSGAIVIYLAFYRHDMMAGGHEKKIEV